MINNISWGSYGIAVALISLGYYLVIYLLYFKSIFKLSVCLNQYERSQANIFPTPPSVQGEGKVAESMNEKTPLLEQQSGAIWQAPLQESKEYTVRALIDELQAFFAQSGKTKAVKQEMIYSLQRLLRKYPSIRASEYEDSVNNLIIAQLEDLCSIHLDEEDVIRVWLG